MQHIGKIKSHTYLQTLNQLIAPWAALLVYGLWAAYICYQQSLEHWYINAAIHGIYAFALTIMSRRITLSFKRLILQHFSIQSVIASALTYTVMTAILIILPTIIQLQLHNNEILMTTLPGIIAGQFYLILILCEQ